MNNKRISTFSFWGFLCFLISIAVLTSGAFLAYRIVTDFSKKTSAIVITIILYIIFVTFITSVIDYYRRKYSDKRVFDILDCTNKLISGNFKSRIKIYHQLDKYNGFDYISENINVLASELEKTELINNDFISNISHEIKTPVAVINNYAKLLKVEYNENNIDTIINATNRLNNLITNMLKLNKLENQEIIPTLSSVNLYDSLSDSIISFEDMISDKSINLRCELDEIIIHSIPDYLELIWNNLISNAIKFTNNNGNITIKLYREDDKAVVIVSDDGCGISKEGGEHIFDKFYQGDKSHNSIGNGLGLALVKKIIDIMGGEIYVESELNKGSKFILKFLDQKKI